MKGRVFTLELFQKTDALTKSSTMHKKSKDPTMLESLQSRSMIPPLTTVHESLGSWPLLQLKGFQGVHTTAQGIIADVTMLNDPVTLRQGRLAQCGIRFIFLLLISICLLSFCFLQQLKSSSGLEGKRTTCQSFIWDMESSQCFRRRSGIGLSWERNLETRSQIATPCSVHAQAYLSQGDV